MENNPEVNLPSPIENKKLNPSVKTIFFLITTIGIGLITAFSSGFFLKQILTNEAGEPTLSPQPSITPLIPELNPESSFLPGKFYFDDTIMLITVGEPHYTVVATANRSQKDTNYVQGTRASYFNGEKWVRVLQTSSNPDSGIYSNNIIKNWTINVDPSKVLRQNVAGNLKIEDNEISFNSSTLENEISIRALPGYTKFSSEGKGNLIINGSTYESYILYTRIYSFDASQLVTYDGSFNLTTDWVAFWDQNGNFYHIDNTEVETTQPNYQTHSVGIFKNSAAGVLKTFNMNVERDENKPPVSYSISLNSPINKQLVFDVYSSINKSSNNSYIWYMGQIKGRVTDANGKSIPGFGITEYINK